MRGSTFAVVAALLAASSAFANNNNSSAAANSATTAPLNEQATDTSLSAATTMATIEDVKAGESRWGATYWQAIYNTMADTNRGLHRSTVGDSYAAVSYKLNKSQKVTLMQNFWQNQTDADRSDEAELYDTTLRYTDVKAAQLAGSDVVADYRLYLPVSEWSREVGKLEARSTFVIERKLSKAVTAEYAINTRAYAWNHKEGQRFLRNFLAAKVAYELNSVVSPYVAINHQGAWRHDGLQLTPEGNTPDPENMYTAGHVFLGSGVKVNDNIGMDLYLEQERNLRAEDHYELFNENETTYNIEFSVSI